jgi:hypothetical protein
MPMVAMPIIDSVTMRNDPTSVLVTDSAEDVTADRSHNKPGSIDTEAGDQRHCRSLIGKNSGPKTKAEASV